MAEDFEDVARRELVHDLRARTGARSRRVGDVSGQQGAQPAAGAEREPVADAGTLPDGRRPLVDAEPAGSALRQHLRVDVDRRAATTTGWSTVLTKRFSRGNVVPAVASPVEGGRRGVRQRLHGLRRVHVAVGSARSGSRSRAVGLRHAPALHGDARGRAESARPDGRTRRASSTAGRCRAASSRRTASASTRRPVRTATATRCSTIGPSGQAYNSFELPAYVTLDLRLTRLLDSGGGRKLELMVEGFNLTNRLNPTNVNRTWGPNATPNATFNTPTGAETARQFQLAARFSF